MTQKESAQAFLIMAASGNTREAYEKFISPHLIHHNQHFNGDRLSLMTAMEEDAKKNSQKTLEIKKILEDGDTVMTLSHVKQNPDVIGSAVVHIFKFKNNQIIEMWDLGQAIMKDSPNKNGVF